MIVKRGDLISVYWPDDSAYYPGTIKHMHHDGNVTGLYDDGKIERWDLDNEKGSPKQASVTSSFSATVMSDADHPNITDNKLAVV